MNIRIGSFSYEIVNEKGRTIFSATRDQLMAGLEWPGNAPTIEKGTLLRMATYDTDVVHKYRVDRVEKPEGPCCSAGGFGIPDPHEKHLTRLHVRRVA